MKKKLLSEDLRKEEKTRNLFSASNESEISRDVLKVKSGVLVLFS